eukprot:2554873-Alexandrium_andersonii.AAC.1
MGGLLGPALVVDGLLTRPLRVRFPFAVALQGPLVAQLPFGFGEEAPGFLQAELEVAEARGGE